MKTPKMRQRPDGRFVVTFSGKDYYLGRDRLQAEKSYCRMAMKFLETGSVEHAEEQPDLAILLNRYTDEKKAYFGDLARWTYGGMAVQYLHLFDHYKADDISMREFRILRERMLQPTESQKVLCRNTVNRLMREVALFFRWCAEHEYCKQELAEKAMLLKPLAKGHTKATESEPVTAVTTDHIDAVRARVNQSVRALIDLQLYTGARPGELLALRPEDIDRSGEVWTACLTEHKTAHLGKARTIYFGERSQEVLRPFLLRRHQGEYLFQPSDYLLQRSECAETRRREGQSETERKTSRTLGPRYTVASYRNAIYNACERAGIPKWHPHQLRHTAATEIRRLFGLEAAKAVLGHSSISTTQIYAEADIELSKRVALQHG